MNTRSSWVVGLTVAVCGLALVLPATAADRIVIGEEFTSTG